MRRRLRQLRSKARFLRIAAHESKRADGTSETARKPGLWRRLTLRRADGQVYLDRWGVGHDRIGRVLVHKMSAPDPGVDLHDHPWTFVSIVLWGGYDEERADTRDAFRFAEIALRVGPQAKRGHTVNRRWLSARRLRLDECHRITRLHRRTCWTLVVAGPRRRGWGFYLPHEYLPEALYDATVRAGRRDLWSDQNVAARPWKENADA